MHSTAIIVAAGSGKRMRSEVEKPFILLKGKPLLVHAISAVSRSKDVKDVLVVANKGSLGKVKRLVGKTGNEKVVSIVPGGKYRANSVFNGLKALPETTDMVLVHDCARPFISIDLIGKLIIAAKKYGAVIPGVSASSTVKMVSLNRVIIRTLSRSHIYMAQTPQVFKREILERAYENIKTTDYASITDDSSLVEKMGIDVKVVDGDPHNIKITFKADLVMAEAMMAAKNIRI